MKVMWKCRDGREIAIVDMSESHLLNTIRFCERLAEKRADLEANNCYWMDSEEAIVIPSEWCLPPQYETMVAVAKARGLVV